MKTLLFIFGFTFSIQAFAGLDVSLWSYRYLARASNVLLVASDQHLANEKVICGINGKNISLLSQALKAIVDEKIRKLTFEQKNQIRSQVGSCQEECTCDLYSNLLMIGSSSDDHAAMAKINAVSKPYGPGERLKCAQNFSQFCRSQLLKTISR
jgi:hypothetical protein